MRLIEFDNSGRIFHVVDAPWPKELEAAMAANGQRFRVVNTAASSVNLMENYWVPDGSPAMVLRPDFPVPADATLLLGGDPLRLSGLPVPTEVRINGGEPIVVEHGEIEFAPAMAGTYSIDLAGWPYVPATIAVTVHEG